ncbi:MAG TPA: TonB-dependent receptor, partial [Terriglobia bacterium]|nr:TonB-dependent receptor [Terriglobia bacterium]
YGDSTGGVLNVQTRDGSRERMFGRANVAATGLSYTGEGPIGHSRNLSWLGSFRESYADWLIERLADDPMTAVALGFTDAFLKLSYAPSDRHRFSVTAMGGNSRANREREREALGVNSLLTADQRTRILNAQWRWIGSRAISTTEVYYSRGTGENHNVGGELLFLATARESALRNDTTYQLGRGHTLQAGLFLRQRTEDALRRRFSTASGFIPTDEFAAEAGQPGYYVEDTWSPRRSVTLTLGGRVDEYSPNQDRVVLPRANVSFNPHPRLTISAGWGQYAQFPDLASLYGEFGRPDLGAPRSMQSVIAIEHRVSERSRLRVEVYDKEEHSVLFSEETEPRLVNGAVTFPAKSPVLRNTLRGYSRGIEVYFQRRSANRLSGWISYALGFTHFRDDRTGLDFDGDFDQRHTVNLYGSYRVSRSLNLSLKFRYGSNFPAIGFLAYSGSTLVLAAERNQVRLPQYVRLDVRANRAFHFDSWKMTLYMEVSNALKRHNVRFSDLDRINSSGRVLYFRENLLPLLPSIGISVEF